MSVKLNPTRKTFTRAKQISQVGLLRSHDFSKSRRKKLYASFQKAPAKITAQTIKIGSWANFLVNQVKKLSFLRSLTLLSAITIYLINPAAVAADFLTVTVPAEVNLQTAFKIDLQISAKAQTTYFIKARLGNKTNQLNQGQTFSSDKGIWLSDTVSWTSFPQFTTDENGMWSGNITAQTTGGIPLGQNYLVVRTRDQDGNVTDSATYTLNVTQPVVTTPPPTEPKPVQIGEPILNEFMAQPASGSEWVEIKNKGASPADLSNWLVDDEPGKSTPQALPDGTIIPAGGFYVVEFKSPKLNDLTDQVRLLKPDQTEVESYRYDHTEKGSSWSKDKAGTWFLTTSITQGAENAENTLASAPAAATAKTASKPTTLSNSVADEPEKSTAPTSPSPKVLGQTSVATVAAASIQKGGPVNRFFGAPLFILGALCLALSAVIFFKRKLKISSPKASVVYSSVKMEKWFPDHPKKLKKLLLVSPKLLKTPKRLLCTAIWGAGKLLLCNFWRKVSASKPGLLPQLLFYYALTGWKINPGLACIILTFTELKAWLTLKPPELVKY